ncbi:bifunctional UDP-N-acetylmuramoyl-tripeptide:D-alanyl-D-alanine ligase/alanine racemase [Ekhidna sp. To15]|uniref:bifunctional UDP-N-acetylmuramoyl-tripeptide:D-alanyl-D-alanine ligase/alanine racemase n=1 Tax=Ekhidna sp. To15 TaxID=3395267 RepID=UPI003F52711F
MLFSSLQKITNGDIYLSSDSEVSRFSVDSRTLVGHLEEVFIAIKGKRDGHDYIHSAQAKGVKNFILDTKVEIEDANILVVEDTLQALHQIAKNYREKFDIPIVGITGSNGKTTVKEWLSTILSEKYYVVKSPKSYNSQVGVPLSLMEIGDNHEVGIFEAGISRLGEMKKLQHMIQPTLCIFTNLGEAHDDGFDSSIQKLYEKLLLFKAAEKVICRSDMRYFEEAKSKLGSKLITWGESNADYAVHWDRNRILVNETSYGSKFVSKTQLENLTHCIIAALELGLRPEQIQKGLNLVEGVPMRLELKKGINGSYILDDSYNNDEAGLKVALDYLESHKQNEKRTLILSDIIHSGKSDEHLYQNINEILKGRGISRLIAVGPRISANKQSFSLPTSFFNSTRDLLDNLPDFKEEMIIVKGARNFELERVVHRLEEKSHGTVLEVNFEALQYNLNQYRAMINDTTKLMVMVKANAYGSGLLEVANFLQHQLVNMLGVAYVNEAIELRKNGITIPIMIMNPYIESFEQFERFDLQAEIFSISHFRRMLRDTNKHPKVHLKIDTGMHRLGFHTDQLDDLIEILKANPKVKVEGIFTHFSSSDTPKEDDFTVSQANDFEKAYTKIASAIGYNPTKHALNSPGMVRWPQYHFDMVRLGIGLHGFDPVGKLELRHASTLKTVVSQVQDLKKGETVGYSRKGKLTRNSQIAIIPIGYEDGYSRIFGNGNANVMIDQKLCPTIGNICMDMTMVDVTGLGVREGDEVIVFGSSPSIKELATWAGTIPYEILTNVSNRVKRIFVSE